jgi:hypothetical protein
MILQSAYAEKDGTQGGGETMFDIQYLPGNLFVIIFHPSAGKHGQRSWP